MTVSPSAEFLVVDENKNITELDNSGLVASQIVMLYGSEVACGKGMLSVRTDSHGMDEWNNHKVTMRLLEARVEDGLELMRSYAGTARADGFSAQLGGMNAQDLVHKFTRGMEERLPELASTRVFHQNTEVKPGARQYQQFRTYDTGKAIVYGGGDGTDIPRVGTGQTSFFAPVRYLISAGTVNWLEQLSARFAGLDRTLRKTRRMRRVIAELIDEWAFLGSTAHGIRGLFNHPYMESAISVVPYTMDSAADDITADFGYYARYAQNVSKGAFKADTLLISEKLEGALSNRPYGDNADKNLLDWMLNANKHITKVEVLARLNDIGGPGIHGMAFIKTQGGPADISVEVMSVMPETMLPPEVRSLQTDFYCVSASGGINQVNAGDNLIVYVQGVE